MSDIDQRLLFNSHFYKTLEMKAHDSNKSQAGTYQSHPAEMEFDGEEKSERPCTRSYNAQQTPRWPLRCWVLNINLQICDKYIVFCAVGLGT